MLSFMKIIFSGAPYTADTPLGILPAWDQLKDDGGIEDIEYDYVYDFLNFPLFE